MKLTKLVRMASICCSISLLSVGCNNSTTDSAPKTIDTEAAAPVAAKPDMAKVKAEIQALENSWAAADNARDTNAVAAFYADDAISLSNNKPMISGKEAIKKDIAASLAKRPKGGTVTYEVMDVYGDDQTVTEVGKSVMKDASGKTTGTGKYIAVWEKRDGKFICVRDIYNDDQKQ